jgi:hypothetical protein
MRDSEKGCAARWASGAGATQDRTNTRKRTTGRREVQGTATDRNADQRAPRWTPPPGEGAARDLSVALRGWSALLGRPPIDPRGRK